VQHTVTNLLYVLQFRRYNVFYLSVRSSVRPLPNSDILKMNGPISMQTDTRGPRGKGRKRSASRFRRSKVKVRGGQNCILRPGGGIVLDVIGLSRISSFIQQLQPSQSVITKRRLNHLIPTLKPHNNGKLYSNTVIGTLAVDGWAATSGKARSGLGGLRSRPVPS